MYQPSTSGLSLISTLFSPNAPLSSPIARSNASLDMPTGNAAARLRATLSGSVFCENSRCLAATASCASRWGTPL